MPNLKLSICIPTYNRATYLETLLAHLQEVVSELPFETEIIISDNASSDTTLALLEAAQAQLPLTILQQSENIGAVPNMHAAMRAGRGTYLVYLADDDRLRPDALASSIEMLDANPAASALYAPWRVKDLVKNQVTGQFYTQPGDVTIDQGNYSRLLEHIVERKIFSEICIVRRDVFRAVSPIINSIAHWAFTTPAEYLAAGDLIYAKRAFYVSISRHFDGDIRAQAGFEETMSGWDSYSGGVEVLLGLAVNHGGLSHPEKITQYARALASERMACALRLRLQSGRDPLESYALAARLRGKGLESLLPAPMLKIRNNAALYFAGVKLPEVLRAKRITVIGNCDGTIIKWFQDGANLPVHTAAAADEIDAGDVVIDFGCQDKTMLDAAGTRALAHVTEALLMQKFA